MTDRRGAALTVAAVAMLAACSSAPSRTNPGAYEAALQQWVGRSETELINAWGVPDKSQLLSQGGQVLEYDTRDGKNVTCSTLFTSNLTGTIERYSFRGSDCRPPNASAAGGVSGTSPAKVARSRQPAFAAHSPA